MLRGTLELLRRRYFIVQAIALVIWLLLEVSGYGFGILHAMFRQRLTDADSNVFIRLVGMAPPPGPVRLSRSEREAVQQRIAATFTGSAPKSVSLSDLRFMYTLKPGSLCDWRSGSIASDPKDCNQLTDASALFRTLLASMHAKTETLMLVEKRGYKGDLVTAAFFVGTSGKPKMLFDFSRSRRDQWAMDKGFKLKVYHPNGLSDVDLGKEIFTDSSIYLIDDPGKLDRRRGLCGQATCPSQLLLYGYDPREGGRERNLVDFDIDPDIEKRFALYAALLNNPASSPKSVPVKSLPPEPYKVARIEVTTFNTVKLDRSVDAVFGDGARTRILYSPVGYDVAFGTVYGVRIDGKLFTIWDGGDSFPSLGTDRFVFDLGDDGKLRRIDNVRCHVVVCFLPTSGAELRGPPRLEVRKFIEQSGKPWSEFADFEAVFKPLRHAQ